jgi:hypothetical protein
MPLNIPPGFAQVGLRMIYSGDPEPMVCTFGLDISAAGGDFDNVRSAIEVSADDNLSDIFSTVISFIGVDLAIGQDGGNPVTVSLPFFSAFSGTDTGSTNPQNCAYLIKKFSTTPGRQGRGRMYQPGTRESQVNDLGVVTAAEANVIGAGWNAFFSQLANGLDPVPDLPVVILHTVGTPVQTPSPLAGVQCDSVIATQRRRLRR